ncbi:MAG: FtsH protease activity modulator HflK [Planctomycetota bacterium]
MKPLEDLLREMRSGRRGGPRPAAVVAFVATGILAILVVVGVFSSYYAVPTDSQAVVKRFGRVVAVTPPGLHFKWPFGIETANLVQTDRVQKLEFGFRTEVPDRRSSFSTADFDRESLMLTGDLNVVEVSWVVQYRILDPDRWLHAMRDPTDTIRDLSESVTRRIVGNMIGSRVLTTGRQELGGKVLAELQRILDTYKVGVKLEAVELRDVTPPDPVKPAFNEVNESRQEKEKMLNVAEKERNEVIPRARGEAAQVIAQAQAYAAERVNDAKGEAARFLSILTEYEKASEVTRRRLFLEMVDGVIPRLGNLVVVDPAVGGPLPLLDLNKLGAQSTAARPTAPARTNAPGKESR